MKRPRPLVLVILDGFGLRADQADNAIELAKAPRWNDLLARYPHTRLSASGPDVGLPKGQFGNSEVGHMNLGAGRVAQMDISRIDVAVAEGAMARNPEIHGAIELAQKNGGALHLLGLVSDGGVHSSIEHLLALIDAAVAVRVPVVVHAFLDGRDTAPRCAAGYLARVEEKLAGGHGKIGTVIGRYWAMDRDHRWERVERAFRAMVYGGSSDAAKFAEAKAAVDASYGAERGDEFVEPSVIGDYAGVAAGKDTAIFFNFRSDRAREISEAITSDAFTGFERGEIGAKAFARYVCMTEYDPALRLPVAFPKATLPELFTDVIAGQGMAQYRCAETEKFAHVTFFFNGGKDVVSAGEERMLIPSPRDVPTYDFKPEMSAKGVSEAVVRAVESDRYDFILVNFANPDMVGHTGVLDAAVRAIEAVDEAVGAVVDAVKARGGVTLITADHGNCEVMRDPVTGDPHTAHTSNPVPFVLVDDGRRSVLLNEGRLCDVAPTMLALLGLAQPAAMTGTSLLGETDPGA